MKVQLSFNIMKDLQENGEMEGKPQEGWPHMESVRTSLNIYGAPFSICSQVVCAWLSDWKAVALMVRAPREVTWITASILGDTGICYKIIFSLLWHSQDLLNPTLSKFEEYIRIMVSCWEYPFKKLFTFLIFKVSFIARFKE